MNFRLFIIQNYKIYKVILSFHRPLLEPPRLKVDSSSEKASCSPLCDDEVLPLIQEGFKRVYLAHDYFEFSQHLQEHLILRFTTF